jgi:hypothetical protein
MAIIPLLSQWLSALAHINASSLNLIHFYVGALADGMRKLDTAMEEKTEKDAESPTTSDRSERGMTKNGEQSYKKLFKDPFSSESNRKYAIGKVRCLSSLPTPRDFIDGEKIHRRNSPRILSSDFSSPVR